MGRCALRNGQEEKGDAEMKVGDMIVGESFEEAAEKAIEVRTKWKATAVPVAIYQSSAGFWHVVATRHDLWWVGFRSSTARIRKAKGRGLALYLDALGIIVRK